MGAEMSKKDERLRIEINRILHEKPSGVKLKDYFESMPKENIRRAIFILAEIYPDGLFISNDDFLFVRYMMSNQEFIKQQTFPDLIRSLSVIKFTKTQKNMLISIIKENIGVLCASCTFELDGFLAEIFERADLLEYLKVLAKSSDVCILEHVSDIFRYDFLDVDLADALAQRAITKRTAGLRPPER